MVVVGKVVMGLCTWWWWLEQGKGIWAEAWLERVVIANLRGATQEGRAGGGGCC